MTIRFKPTDLPDLTELKTPACGNKTNTDNDIWPFSWLPFGMEY